MKNDQDLDVNVIAVLCTLSGAVMGYRFARLFQSRKLRKGMNTIKVIADLQDETMKWALENYATMDTAEFHKGMEERAAFIRLVANETL